MPENKSRALWDASECALVLMDYQDNMFNAIFAQMSPRKRLGTTQDIADVVAFVMSDQGRWLTGQNIHASGGVVM